MPAEEAGGKAGKCGGWVEGGEAELADSGRGPAWLYRPDIR